MIKIYHVPGSRSLRVVWLMEELGEPYELKLVPVPFDAAFLAENPQGSVPFIVEDGVAMAESIAILQYITGTRLASRPSGAPTFTIGPRPDPAAYAAHLQFLHLGEGSLAIFGTLIAIARRMAPEGARENFTTELCAARFVRRLSAVEHRLADGRAFLMGDQFTIADISVGFALRIAEAQKLAMPEVVDRYYRRLTERPAYQRAIAK